MADERSLTLLHVSDMQFGRHHQFPQETDAPPDECDNLLTRLADDLDLLRREEGLQPDLLVCTGDLAEWAWPVEFADAYRFLGALAARLGLGRERVIAIPGNHDVNRDEGLHYFKRCRQSGEQIVPPWYPKWQPYEKAFADFYKDAPTVHFTPDEPWSLFAIPDLEVVVAGLNSTWIDGPDWPADGSLPQLDEQFRPRHAGWCGEKQLRWFAEKLAAREYLGWLHLGAVHHNLERGARADDENLRDAEDFERVLGEHLDLVLHGHTHRARFGQVRDKFPWFATGSAGLKQGARPYGVPNQYQFLVLHPEGVRIRARFYLPEDKAWADEVRLQQDRRPGAREVKWAWRNVLRFPPPAPPERIRARDPELRRTLEDAAGFRHRTKEALALFRKHAAEQRHDDFLAAVAKCCELRLPPVREGGAPHRIEEIRPPDGATPYLRVSSREAGFVAQYPVAATAERPSPETLTQFSQQVLAQYRAAAPGTIGEFVFGGPLVADDALRQHAAALGLRLKSLLEFQGLIDFGAYLAQQNRRVASDPVYPPRLYVPQRMQFEDGAEPAETADALEQIAAWLTESGPRFVLLLGEAGTGKTFLVRELARRIGLQPGAPVPLLIDLRSLEKAADAGEKGLRLDQLLAQHLSRHKVERFDLPALHYMMRQGRVILLFDGFDELALRVGYEKADEHLDTLIEAAAGDSRVLVSSRTSHFENDRQVRNALGRHVEQLRGVRFCRLHKFDASQIRRFLVNQFGSAEEADLWFALLDDIKDLLGLGENPRMLSFICQLRREQLEEARARTGRISAAELYRLLLVENWLGFEDTRRHPRGVPRLLEAQQWLEPLTHLALELWTRTDRWLALHELQRVVVTALEHFAPDKISQAAEATQLFGSGTFFIRDDEGRFTFVHQSVLEWLVAGRLVEEMHGEKRPALLATGRVSELMADFLLDLGAEEATTWSSGVLIAEEETPDLAKSNALTVYQRQLRRLEETVATAPDRAAAAQRLEDWRYVFGLRNRLKLAGRDLRGEDLSRLDLRGADLSGTDLREVVLAERDLSDAILTDADLRGAVCDGAKFLRAQMERVKAEGCSALGADFTGATLTRSAWRRARLLGATLTPEQMEEMDLWGATLPDGAGVEVRLPSGASGVNAVVWSPDGTLLASGHEDGTVRIHEAATGRELLACKGHEGDVNAVSWSPDGVRLASGSNDCTVRVWDAQSGRELLACKGSWAYVDALSWSPDGTCLASGSADKTVRVWEAQSGRELLACHGHDNRVLAVGWSPDGTRLASGSADKTVRVWEARSGRELLACKGHESFVMAVGWSPDGTRLASGSWDQTVRVWETHSDRELLTGKGHASYVAAVSWSPDGMRLASASDDQTVRVWEAQTGRELLVCKGHASSVVALSWSPDGTWLASGSHDKTVRVWEAHSGRELLRYKGIDGEPPELSAEGKMRWPPVLPDGTPCAPSDSFHGAGLCRLSLEEVRRWRSDLFLPDANPTVP